MQAEIYPDVSGRGDITLFWIAGSTRILLTKWILNVNVANVANVTCYANEKSPFKGDLEGLTFCHIATFATFATLQFSIDMHFG